MRQNILLVALSAATVATAQERNFTVNIAGLDRSLKCMHPSPIVLFPCVLGLTMAQPIGVLRNITLAAYSATTARLPMTAKRYARSRGVGF